jgi:diketogulonate reductase-like aldo/keto reductase
MIETKKLGASDVEISALGMGTWGIGGFSSPSGAHVSQELEALRLGMDLGMKFIDTAEIYARGHSEEVVGEAVAGQRDQVFIATKVSAEHLRYEEVLRAAERSLKRLKTNRIDLYQIHWPNPRIPISETMRAMEKLVDDGRVRFVGVSNFSVAEMREAQSALSKHGLHANQVEYSLTDRSIEADVLPYCQKEHITVIAYSPLARGALAKSSSKSGKRLLEIGAKYGKTTVQVALRWLLDQDQVVAIPKSARTDHVREIVGAAGWSLSRDDHHAVGDLFNYPNSTTGPASFPSRALSAAPASSSQWPGPAP